MSRPASAADDACARPPWPEPDARGFSGRCVALERLAPARHGPALWAAIGADPALWTLIPPGPFGDVAAFRAWLGERAVQAGTALYAAIDRTAPTPAAAGLLFLLRIEPGMGTLEFGLVLGPALARRTGGTEAVFLLMRHVFEDLGYRRLEWRCDGDHAASRRSALRLGFREEGVLRRNVWIKGAPRDTVVHALLDTDWPAAGATLAAWLAPENFDATGLQRTPLRVPR